jgi:large subunit ribosomal protein L19
MSNSCPTIEAIERGYNRSDLPLFRSGDTVRVHALISEGGKERIQVFEGVCIHRKRGGARGSFTVRKVSHGVGVERVWPENSPRVVKVELVSRGRVRRAKLYYLRDLSGNAARIREKLGDYADLLSGAPVTVAEADVALAEGADLEGGNQKKKADKADKAPQGEAAEKADAPETT